VVDCCKDLGKSWGRLSLMQSSAVSVNAYLKELDASRSSQIKKLVKLVRENIKPGFDEVMRWGMISYEVPMELSGDTYNNQPLNYAAIASQKQYISVYLNIYAEPDALAEFQKRWAKSGKKLNMGKSCVRFKSIEDADLETIAWAIRRQSAKQYLKIVQSYGKA
jgi:hypothetical protein